MNKRRYNSEARQAQAELTKKHILAAAKELFSQQGFDKATIGGVAKRAGVSVPSVYGLYQSKEGLLRELVYSTIFGTEYTTLVNQVVTVSDPVACIKIAARITRHVCEIEEAEIGFIRGAAVLSPALKALEREAEQLRYERQEVLVRRLFEEHAVLPEIDFVSTRDILWSLTSRDMYRMMVVERQWSPEKYEKWLADTLAKALIKEEAIVAEATA